MLGELTYRNLDDDPRWPARTRPPRCSRGWSPTGSATGCTPGALGEGARAIAAVMVTLHESHVAWASYERAP